MSRSITFDIALKARDNFAETSSRLKKVESEIKKTILRIPVFELKCKPQIIEADNGGFGAEAIQPKKNQDRGQELIKSINKRMSWLGNFDGNEFADYIVGGKSYDAVGWVKKTLSEINVFKSALRALGLEAENGQEGLKEQLRELKKAAYGTTAEQNEDGTIYDRLTGRTYSNVAEWENSDYKAGDSGILRDIADVAKEVQAVDKAIKDVLADMSEVKPIGICESVSELEGAIGVLEGKIKRAGVNEAMVLAQTKTAYEQKLAALKSSLNIPELAAAAARINTLTGTEHKVAVKGIGFDELKKRIAELRELLANKDIDLGEGQRQQIESLIGVYKKWQREAVDSVDGVCAGLNGMGQVLGSIAKLTDESAGAWLNWGAQILSTVAQALPAIMAVATGNAINSAAQTPVVGWVLAGAAVASILAAFAAIPKFADGGIAYGPTLGLFGEYAGASNNPEVVAPLSKLRGLLGDAGGGGVAGGRVVFEIEGRKLKGVLQKVEQFDSRVR